METLSQKTISVSKENALAQKKWVVVDAEGQILGRMCSKVAKILRGKYKPCFTPNQDCGDNVIIVNAAKIELTGKKMTDHVYIRYTGYPGGQRFSNPEIELKKSPERYIKKVVKGMLPKNRLGNRLITNLYVFDGPEHNMQAQQPVKIDINTLK
ncbi:MAG: 50S ribosomal protein L13 [Paludibacteraceae bacterium]|nr:50S ribosomal protein L13 [Paludibacteraceae bacterium]